MLGLSGGCHLGWGDIFAFQFLVVDFELVPRYFGFRKFHKRMIKNWFSFLLHFVSCTKPQVVRMFVPGTSSADTVLSYFMNNFRWNFHALNSIIVIPKAIFLYLSIRFPLSIHLSPRHPLTCMQHLFSSLVSFVSSSPSASVSLRRLCLIPTYN